MLESKRLKTVLLLLWASVLIIGLIITARHGVSPRDALSFLTLHLESLGIWASLGYLVIYSIRGLIFFPASLLTIGAGALFGPIQGLFLTMIGENISANLSFIISRYFKGSILKFLSPSAILAAKIACYSEKNGFTLVLISRLIFLPFDLVSYSSGMSCIRQKDFTLGTLIGTIPGLLTYTLLGSSILDVRLLGVAIASLAASLLIAHYLKKREAVLSAT